MLIFYNYFLSASVVSFKVGQNVLGLIFGVCFLLIFLIFFTKPKLEAKKAYANYKKLYGREVETKTFFYDEIVVSKNLQSNQLVQASYTDVTSIEESNNLYVIKFHKNIVLTLDKNRFVSSNLSEFKKFIKEKCYNAKVNL